MVGLQLVSDCEEFGADLVCEWAPSSRRWRTGSQEWGGLRQHLIRSSPQCSGNTLAGGSGAIKGVVGCIEHRLCL